MSDTPLSLKDLERFGELPTRDLAVIPGVCDVLRPIAADARETIGVELYDVQGGDMLRPILRLVRSPHSPRQVHLLTGLPGSGKSTQMLRLQAELEREGTADDGTRRLRTVYVDAMEYIPIQDLDSTWVLLCLVAEVVKQFETFAKASKSVRLMWDDLRQVVDTSTLEAGAELNLGLVKLAGRIKSDHAAREMLRLRLPSVTERLIDHLNAFVKELRGSLAKQGYDDLVLIVDNLEKMVPRELDSGRDTFSATFLDGAPLFRRLDLHVVLTVPLSLCYRDAGGGALTSLYGTEPLILPMVRIKKRDGSDHDEGLAALRALLAKRLDLSFTFENEDLVRDVCLASGGWLRLLMQIVTGMSLETDNPPMTRAHFERIMTRHAGQIDERLPREFVPVLAEVALTHDFDSTTEGRNAVKELCLQSLFALRYNGEGHWFDVHTALWRIPRFVRAVEALRAQKA